MRIAYIYDAVYPFVKGGVEKRIYEIGSRLVRRHEVHWFGLDWGGSLKGIIFHPAGRWDSLYTGGRRSITEAVYFASKLLLKFQGKYDLIDCQQFPYLPCIIMKLHSMARGIPLVITWHEFWGDYWFEYLGHGGIFGKGIEKVALGIGNANVSVSKMTWRTLAENGVISTVIPNGIDYEVVQNVRPSEEEYDLIFVGRLIPEKNVELLLRAVEVLKDEIPDIQVAVIGDGPRRTLLESLSTKLNLRRNVFFKGIIRSHEEVISYMKSSKVLVLPSRREGFGMVAIEANAAGIPVVTLDYPMNAVKDLIIPGYNGTVSKPSKRDLAESILKMIENHRKLRQNCIKNAKKYDWDNIAELTEKFYERVSNER